MKRPSSVPFSLLLAGDVLLAAGAYRLAFRIREVLPLPGTRDLLPPERFAMVEHRWMALAALAIAAAWFSDLYRELPGKRFRELAGGAAGAAGLASLGIVATHFFADDRVFPRTVVPLFWILDAAAIFGFRTLVLRLIRPRVARVLLVGRTETAARLIEEIRSDRLSLRRVVGVLREEGDRSTETTFAGVPVLGDLDTAAPMVAAGQVDEILLAPESDWRDRLLGEIARLEGTGVKINVAPSLYEVLLGKLAHVNLHDRPLLEVVRDPGDPLRDGLKRLFDFLFALALLPLAIVVGLPVAMAIRIGSPGPILFRQERIGWRGKRFVLFKFRTMVQGAENETGAVLASDDDPRATTVGRFLRVSRLDEIPQLWNVVTGDMSFVGPRPERPEFVEGFDRTIPGYVHRHLVRPGITGLAQVRGRYHTDASVKLMYDLVYVYNRTVWLDVLILVETGRTVLAGRGA